MALPQHSHVAIASWVGVFAPIVDFSTSTAKVSKLSATTPDRAQKCLEVPRARPDMCDASACDRKSSGRCVPRSSPVMPQKAMNNSVNFEVYEHVGHVVVDTARGWGAHVFACDALRELVVCFPAGAVQRPSTIRANASAFLDGFETLALPFEGLDIDRVVLAGHSEGGATAEAVALHLANGRTGRLLERVDDTHVISSGAHLWMTPAERTAIENAFGDRTAPLVLGMRTSDGTGWSMYDTFVTKHAAGKDSASSLVSLPKVLVDATYAWADASEEPESVRCVHLGPVDAKTRAIEAGGHTYEHIDADSFVMLLAHAWTAYERCLSTLCLDARAGRGEGGGPTFGRPAWHLGVVAVVACLVSAVCGPH